MSDDVKPILEICTFLKPRGRTKISNILLLPRTISGVEPGVAVGVCVEPKIDELVRAAPNCAEQKHCRSTNGRLTFSLQAQPATCTLAKNKYFTAELL